MTIETVLYSAASPTTRRRLHGSHLNGPSPAGITMHRFQHAYRLSAVGKEAAAKTMLADALAWERHTPTAGWEQLFAALS